MEVAFPILKEIEDMETPDFPIFDDDEDMEIHNFSSYDPCNLEDNDERLIWYDWVADTATTSHITHQREAFINYTPSNNTSVIGVGGKKVKIAGRGTVILISTFNGQRYILRLEDVIHVPEQTNNLISLGRWDKSGGTYTGGKGKITLTTNNGVQIARGMQLTNNLYKLAVKLPNRATVSSCDKLSGQTQHKTLHNGHGDADSAPKISFIGKPTNHTWEEWHRRFRHISYSGLQKLLNGNMVEGMNVDLTSPQPDCPTCVEAKLHVKPFSKTVNRKTEPGELTHIDLWGKYAIKSINGNSYYILFVDDSTRYITVDFLKEKNQASLAVTGYLAHLTSHKRMPKAIQVDRGKEFVNQKVQEWCKSQGIELHLTAPYSPSQNGVAERMNRTLVELAHAMIKGQNLPEFIWEHAILHAAYIRNRAYTKHLETLTPYQGWHKRKPNISHLREFGTPVWILQQGQFRDRKMLPKSKRRTYVGFDDGSNAIKFYNTETRKVLVSRNFRTLNLSATTPAPEPIVIGPNQRHEGESEDKDMPSLGKTSTEVITPDFSLKRRRIMDGDNGSHPETESDGKTLSLGHKHQRQRMGNDSIVDSEDIDINKPRTTRSMDAKAVDIRKPRKTCAGTNYQILHDPQFEEENESLQENDYTFAIIAGDELTDLRDAKRSSDWPQWHEAMGTEIKLLTEMGTWELVDKPPDAVPIPNKCVFLKKRNKEGIVTRYRARLVVKGCAQRPGYDFVETFSPVIQMDSLRAILALVPIKKLKIQQLDVKGAYLSGILKETVYMKQPEGFEDGTNRVCHLIKTLYGLKQAGREWNKQLHEKLENHGYTHLISDSCVYSQWNGDNCAIITIWVDDLLLFASSDDEMNWMKNAIKSEWEVTDLGAPTKIIGIEITQTTDSVTISQNKYIKSLLEKEGMTQANPVGMPLDPHIPLESNPEFHEPNRSNSYAKLLGEMQYLANATRPDISYAVC